MLPSNKLATLIHDALRLKFQFFISLVKENFGIVRKRRQQPVFVSLVRRLCRTFPLIRNKVHFNKQLRNVLRIYYKQLNSKCSECIFDASFIFLKLFVLVAIELLILCDRKFERLEKDFWENANFINFAVIDTDTWTRWWILSR